MNTQLTKPIQQTIKEWFTRLLVKLGRVKSVPMALSQINQMLNARLPESFDIVIPNGAGILSLLSLDLQSFLSDGTDGEAANRERVLVKLFCNFEVEIARTRVFNTHLNLELILDPEYLREEKSIGVCKVELVKLELVKDKDSFIKDVNNLANGFLPTPLKSLFNVAMASTTAILGEQTVSGMTKYLSLYNSGNQQRVMDYHRKDIENKIIELSRDKNMRYQLDEEDFEEKLFAELGKNIAFERGQLIFLF